MIDDMDKWVIFGSNDHILDLFNQCLSYEFHPGKLIYIVWSVFDPTDIFVLKYTGDAKDTAGIEYYDHILMNADHFQNEAVIRNRWVRDPSLPVFPHPEPTTQQEARNGFNLWRRWLTSDTWAYTWGYNLNGVPDEPEQVDTPEWLCRGSGQGFWARCRAAERDLWRRSLHHVPSVESF